VRGFAIAAIAAVLSCHGAKRVDTSVVAAGGALTVADRTAAAYSQPGPGLTQDELGARIAGMNVFRQIWESDQLGMVFNNKGCIGCHVNFGRGESKIGPGDVSQSLVRVSLGSGDPAVPGGPVPVPGFGLQLRDHSLLGAQQANIYLTWIDKPGSYGDGSAFTLRAPSVDIKLLSGEPFPADALRSYRQAPAVFGLGLLEAVPAATILALADPHDANGDGIKGVANMVWNVETKAPMLGRFGQKANMPTIRTQAAAAFATDLGIVNPLFPGSNAYTVVGDTILDEIQLFLRTEAVPAQKPLDGDAVRGSELFAAWKCAACHVPTLQTGPSDIPALANQTIHPYTDLLVHQMGSGLADGRADFLADGESFRTTPLWGLGLVQVVDPKATFLHDGRARTLAEAILWHGGEAASAAEAFRTAPAADRGALLDFLSSL
jgi:CxxC motif-containing protein (DUF1111 family)